MNSFFTVEERLSICGTLANITAVAAKCAKGISQAHRSFHESPDQMAIEIQNIRDHLDLMEKQNRIPRYESKINPDEFIFGKIEDDNNPEGYIRDNKEAHQRWKIGNEPIDDESIVGRHHGEPEVIPIGRAVERDVRNEREEYSHEVVGWPVIGCSCFACDQIRKQNGIR